MDQLAEGLIWGQQDSTDSSFQHLSPHHSALFLLQSPSQAVSSGVGFCLKPLLLCFVHLPTHKTKFALDAFCSTLMSEGGLEAGRFASSRAPL